MREQLSLQTSTNGMISNRIETFVSMASAQAAMSFFRAQNWSNPLAFASIWDSKRLMYAEKWQGGVAFGPKDTRHPIERMMKQAIRLGLPVTVVDHGRVTKFNQMEASNAFA